MLAFFEMLADMYMKHVIKIIIAPVILYIKVIIHPKMKILS